MQVPEPIAVKITGLNTRGWKVIIPGNRPLATPAVAGDRVFVGGGFGSHSFYAFAADTGRMLWGYRTQDDGPTAAIVEEDLVAFNTESCELEVLTVDGAPVWKKWLGDPLMSMPAAEQGRIFIVYPDSRGNRLHYLACFHLRTGKESWRQPVSGDAITAPVLAEGNVYLTTVDGTVWCFRQNDGEHRWNKARNATSSPTIWKDGCYYSRRMENVAQCRTENVSMCNTLTGLTARDYEETQCQADYLDYAKRQAYSTMEMMSQTLDGSVGFHAGKGDSSMGQSQVNLGHGTVAGLWAYQGSRPFIYRGRLYNCMGRFVQCIDPMSGQVVWRTKIVDGDQHLLDHELTPPALVNGKVFVGTAHGEVNCLSAETGAWLWKALLREPIHFQLAVDNGRVFVPTRTGSLYCLETGITKDTGWAMWGGGPGHNGASERDQATEPE